MTFNKILSNIDPIDLLDIILPEATSDHRLNIVKQFVSWNHTLRLTRKNKSVEKGVLNVIIGITIYHTKGNFNDVYLRKVLETFIDNGIYSTAQAIEYWVAHKEMVEKSDRTRISADEPLWIDDIMDTIDQQY